MRVPESKFSPVTVELVEKIRMWRNSPRIRANMFDDTEIQPQQQQRWFETLAVSSDRQYKVFYQDSKPIGMLSFSEIKKESCFWGCYIGEEAVWPGTGVLLAVAALDYAFNTLDVQLLSAEVFEDNASPIKMHKTFGYAEKPDRFAVTKGGKRVKVKCFEYMKQDWEKNREKILCKLPKQIREAADSIVFE
ncbi:MAG: UDP-4-amino-4,6-dideoxy-N-acetyl-beta-L-altrosamine N-acetyltransferase [Burkholderiaceae bacterium]|nr:UDP-4-amino-4,6-dideoxy-N-acetyl-beta-L-altrosamine N-acetyltransferase [Burkholderiaceae bacterium]